MRTTYSRIWSMPADYAEALAQFRKLLQAWQPDDEVAYGYAMLATQQKRWVEARPLWQELRNDAKHKDEASNFLAQIEKEELAIPSWLLVCTHRWAW